MLNLVFLMILINFNTKYVQSYTQKHREPIFLRDSIKDYCELKCNDKPHTLCKSQDKANATSESGTELIYLFSIEKEKNLKRDLLLGHNGLRDRIAGRMNVSDMIIMYWDKELELMAKRFLIRSLPYETDPCTLISTGVKEEPEYYKIGQNQCFIRNKFFPPGFVAMCLRQWYMERNSMKRPKIYGSEISEKYGVLLEHNNFTRLADPYLFRLGCAVARFEGGYNLICNYYPYVFVKDYVRFSYGYPASYCPLLFPMIDLKYDNLCAGWDNTKKVQPKLFTVCVLCLAIYLIFLTY